MSHFPKAVSINSTSFRSVASLNIQRHIPDDLNLERL